jgi:DNA-binding CsgD family transcriptional regulator
MRNAAYAISASSGFIRVAASLAIAYLLIDGRAGLFDAKTLACATVATVSFFSAVLRPKSGVGPNAFLARRGDTLKLASFGLTERERELVLAHLRGKSMKELAIDRGLALSTVRTAMSSAYRKLGIFGKAGLAALGAKYKIE